MKNKENPTVLYQSISKGVFDKLRICIEYGDCDPTFKSSIFPILVKECSLESTKQINLRESKEDILKMFTNSLIQLIEDYEDNL